MDSGEAYSVELYIYDLDIFGFVKHVSRHVLGRDLMLDGIWHTSVVVHKTEWFYGVSGIESFIPPGSTILGRPQEVRMIGQTNIDLSTLSQHLNTLEKSRFTSTNYHLMLHNCNTFSHELILFLCQNSSGVPHHILDLPETILTHISRMTYSFIQIENRGRSRSRVLVGNDSTDGYGMSNDDNRNRLTDFHSLVEEIIDRAVDICSKKKIILERSSKETLKNQQIIDKYWVRKSQYTMVPRMIIDGYRALRISQFNIITNTLQRYSEVYPLTAALSTGMFIGIVSAWITSLYVHNSQRFLECICWVLSIPRLLNVIEQISNRN